MYGKPNDGPDNFVSHHRSQNSNPTPQGTNGERGLGATVLGGAGGAFLGHKLEHGALGTIGGLAIGAIAANAFEHHEKKKMEERREAREYEEGYERGERRGSRARDIDDDSGYYEDDRYREDEGYYRPHHHHHEDYDRDDYGDDYRDDYRDDYDDRY